MPPRWLLFAALSLALPAQGEPLRVVDLDGVSGEHRDRLKQAAAGRWTLEMGDALVIVGEPHPGAREVDADALLLRPRGCNEHGPEAGRLLARGGRWELREVARGEIAHLVAHGWREVPRNGSVATRVHADAKGAVAPDPDILRIVERFDATRWFADVQALAAFDRSSYGTAPLQAARDFIAARFGALGLAVELMPFAMPGIGGGSIVRHNVIGTWTGSAQPGEWIVVGGHYDSRNTVATSTSPTPGAEDNASGCAGVIELARLLVAAEPRRSIAFMCYAGEEQGLHGSAAHVARLQSEGRLADVALVATLDMIGYSADGDLKALFESSAANAALLQRYAAAAATYAPGLDVVLSTMPFGSDHVPYLNAGLPAALSIENDWDLYPHYHRATDTPANLGPHAHAMAGAILRTNAAVIAESAGVPFQGFADGFE